MNKILKLTLVLFLICAIVAGVLGVVNELTYRRIDEITAAKTKAAFEAVLTIAPDAQFEEIPFSNPDFPTIETVHKATDGAGYVVTSTFSGAQGNITLAVGVDSDYKCSGISVIEHSETSGLGANAASSAEVGVNFRNQFKGQDETIALSKAGGKIDALSGATITSRSVTNATLAAILAVKALG